MARRRVRTVPEQIESLDCPGCGVRYPATARFCERCRLPLVFDAEQTEPLAAVSDRHERARKIKPQLSEGRLVSVARARNQAEGEFIQSMLLEEGVPSMLRRSAGFDVPDMLAAGPRDVMVAQSGVDAAREILLEAEIVSGETVPDRPVSPGRLAAGMLLALGVGVLIVWVLALVIH